MYLEPKAEQEGPGLLMGWSEELAASSNGMWTLEIRHFKKGKLVQDFLSPDTTENTIQIFISPKKPEPNLRYLHLDIFKENDFDLCEIRRHPVMLVYGLEIWRDSH
jgi:hypothetical protein